jgi:hypothetical protein
MNIEFVKEAEICGHAGPAFGCQGCIDKDREAAIRSFYYESLRPNCPDHGPMMVASGDRVAMKITYECGDDEDCGHSEEVPVR